MSFTSIPQKLNNGISNSRGYVDNKANSLLRPKASKGISGFLFDIPDQESLTLDSDITDHFTENNSFINDHIVDKPIIITLSGFIGELVSRGKSGVAGTLQEIDNRLETVDAYLGDLTPGGVQEAQKVISQVQESVSAINQTLDKVQNVVGFFDGEGSENTLQQKAFRELKALKDMKDFVTVQTPWEFYDNMIIKTISFTQNSESKEITDISVTLKEFRVSETRTTDFSQEVSPVREQVQSAPEEDQGIVRGQERDRSGFFSFFVGTE